MSIDVATAAGEPSLLRGSPQRLTEFKEAFQASYIRAVAASAGCVIIGVPEIDEGDDVILSHRSEMHLSGQPVYLALQLKATATFAGIESDTFASTMRRDRYDIYRDTNPTMNRIAVVMSLPESPADWIAASHKNLKVRHAAYWVNLAGQPASTAERPVFRAPRTQIFDDKALCRIMERIGRGGAP